jgi:uncharacterized protein YoaH (UPF0181 family)
MDYYGAMEEAMEDARVAAIETCLPPDLTYEQLKTVITNITDLLKMSLSDGERIALTAKRHEYRLRLRKVDEVAAKLRGESHGN